MSGALHLVMEPPPESPVSAVSAAAVHRPIPDVVTMGHRFLPDAPTSRIVTRLHALLTAIDPGWELEAQLDWLEQLSDWLHRRGWPRGRRLTSANLLVDHDPRTLHLQLLVTVLSNVEPWRVVFSGLMRSVLGQMQATQLFSDIGLPQEPGFCFPFRVFPNQTDSCTDRYWSRLAEPLAVRRTATRKTWMTQG